MYRFNNEGKLATFEEIIGYKGIICEKIADGEYRLKKAFPQQSDKIYQHVPWKKQTSPKLLFQYYS